ncbi:MAG: mechanosensitive ion channel [Sulfurospirillaceae bacterium]|nr:mechanosensitive ion channel [Sulfurospirillaceae bacterium]
MEFNWDSISEFSALYGMRAFVSLLIFIIGKKGALFLSSLIIKGMRKSQIDETIISFFSSIIYGGFLIIIILASLSNLGFDTTSFIAVLGAAGLAIGLALQGTLSNVGAGVLIVFFRPFKIGHAVVLAGESGTVETINLFSTMIKTPDNKQIIIPNSAVIGKSIVNISAKETRRLDMIFTISYESNLSHAKEILQALIQEDTRILTEPPFLIAVSELAETGVKIIVRIWVKSDDYFPVNYDFLEKTKLAFDAGGIVIPRIQPLMK